MINPYIENVIKPYFKQFVETNIDIALFDLEGTLLECSRISATSLGFAYEEIIGLSYTNATTEIIKRICHVDDEVQAEKLAFLCKQISQIQKLVIADKEIISYIDFMPYKHSFSAQMVMHSPVFDNNGEVVATQALSTKHYLFGILDYLNDLAGQYSAFNLINKQKVKFGISERQHEILFLMLGGMSQIDISIFLNISRGNVSKTIQRLCLKFDIEGTRTDKLLNKARTLKLHQYIPPSLNKPRLIILDPEIQSRFKKFSS